MTDQITLHQLWLLQSRAMAIHSFFSNLFDNVYLETKIEPDLLRVVCDFYFVTDNNLSYLYTSNIPIELYDNEWESYREIIKNRVLGRKYIFERGIVS